MHAAVMPMSPLAAVGSYGGTSVEAGGDTRPSIDLSDEQALRAAVREHGAELYRFARRVLGDNGLAEEAVQETFLKAATGPPLRPGAGVAAHLAVRHPAQHDRRPRSVPRHPARFVGRERRRRGRGHVGG